MATPVNYNKMTMGQLKGELTKRELDINGKKSELVNRLLENDVEVKVKLEEAKKAAIEEEKRLAEESKKAEEEKKAEEAAKKIEEARIKKEEDDKKKEESKKESDDIIEQIDDVIKEAASNDDTVKENGEVEKDEEGKTDEEKDTDEKKEGEEKEEKDTDEKKEGEEEEEKKEEEPKEVLKSETYDFLKNANGFYIALDNDQKIVIPVKDTLKGDLKARRQTKTIIVYPLKLDDMVNNTFGSFIDVCQHFTITFCAHSHEREKSDEGFAEFIFGSEEEAQEQADLMSEIRDDLVVRKLALSDKPADLYTDVPQEMISVNTITKKYIYIGNLPSTATEEELKELFPEAVNITIIVNDKELPKGYALAEMENTEAVDEAVKESNKKNYPGYMNKIVIMRPWGRVPKGVLDASSRKELLDKIRNLRKMRMKAMDDVTRNRMENEVASMKIRLDRDCKTRDESGLPVPPDIIRLEQAKANAAKGEKGATGSNISTIQRGGGKPFVRRPGMGAGVLPGGYRKFGAGGPGFSRGGGFGGNRGGFAGSQGQRGPGMNQAVEMLMQVSKMLGPGGAQGLPRIQGGGYGGNQGSTYSSPQGRFNSGGSFANRSSNLGSNASFGSRGSSFGGSTGGSYGSSYGSQGSSYGGSQGGQFGMKRRMDDDGGYGAAKRSTGFYQQKRW